MKLVCPLHDCVWVRSCPCSITFQEMDAMKKLTLLAPVAAIGLTLLMAMPASPAFAGSTYTFSVSEGTQPSNVGTITLTQVNGTTVDVLVDLIDTTLPNPQ